MWVEYNPNPEEKRVGDCVVRALCKATGQDWLRAHTGNFAQSCMMSDMPSSNAVWGAYLRKNGFKRCVIPNACPDCYTVAEFAHEHPKGTYVLATGSHVVCVVDGDWYDTWDSGRESPIYYFAKE